LIYLPVFLCTSSPSAFISSPFPLML
jgi:hypothetical protein